MADVDAQVRDIKERISLAQAAKIRHEVEADRARTTVEQCRAQLKEDFGVETPEDGQRVLDELEAHLARSIQEVTESLERTIA